MFFNCCVSCLRWTHQPQTQHSGCRFRWAMDVWVRAHNDVSMPKSFLLYNLFLSLLSRPWVFSMIHYSPEISPQLETRHWVFFRYIYIYIILQLHTLNHLKYQSGFALHHSYTFPFPQVIWLTTVHCTVLFQNRFSEYTNLVMFHFTFQLISNDFYKKGIQSISHLECWSQFLSFFSTWEIFISFEEDTSYYQVK